MSARLIINADDFGLTPGINRAVIELFQAGVLTSATLMATGPAFENAVTLALANPGLGIGCHLVLTDGIPVSPPTSIPTLIGPDRKTFRPSIFDFAQAALRKMIDPNDLAREAEAQILKIQKAGIRVTHVDTHKHTHVLPGIARSVSQAAQRCGVRPIRNPFEPRWSSALAHAPLSRRLQMRMLERLGPSFLTLTRQAREDGLIPDGTLGIAATGTMDASILRATLDCLTTQQPYATYELLCHPGYNDDALDAQQTRLRASRETDYQTFLEVIPEYSRNSTRLQLIHYGTLGTYNFKSNSSYPGNYRILTGV